MNAHTLATWTPIARRSAQVVAALAAIATITTASTTASAATKKKRVPESEVATAATALKGADKDAAATAATRLGEVRNKTATTALVEALALGLAPKVALAALAALEARADADALPTLEYYLRVRSKKLRAATVRAAAAIGTPQGDVLVAEGLADPTKEVRGVSAKMAVKRRLTKTAPTLVRLLVAGEMPAAEALGDLADAEVARAVAETIGKAPDEPVAEALGRMLLRDDFGPDSLRVEVVRALGKVPNGAGTVHLVAYVAATPRNPPRASRREAEKLMGAKL